MPIDDVTDTARWVAYFRAVESERPDALFRDRLARRLAGERGRAIAEGLPKGPLSWSLAVRTRVFDELIVDAIRDDDIGVVLDLAAGFDARPYRLPLPAGLRWIEVDLPSIVAWKNEVLQREHSVCAVERVPLDLADLVARASLFDRLSAEAARVLVVTEGLLAYLDEEAVGALAEDLVRAFPTALWAMENVAPLILARMQRTWGKTLRSANAEMKFAPAEGLDFFRAHGWAPRATRSLMDEARRLRREMPLAALMRFFSALVPGRDEKFRKAVVYGLLERQTHRSS